MKQLRKLLHSARRQITGLSILQTQPRKVIGWLLFNLLIIAALWGVIWNKAAQQQYEAEISLRARAVLISQAYAEQLSRALHAIDERTLAIKHYWERAPEVVDLTLQSQLGLFGTDTLTGIIISNRDGRVVANSFGSAEEVALGNRDFFKAYRNGRMQGLQIQPPSIGLLSKKTVIRATRDLRSAAGDFNGVVAVSVQPGYFASPYAASQLSPGDILTLRDSHGTMFANQFRDSMDSTARLFVKPPVFSGNAGFEVFDKTVFIDGAARYVGWRQVPGYPLVAVVALSVDEAFAPLLTIQRDYRHFALVWSLFTGVIFFGCLFLYSRLLWRSRDEQKVRNTYRLATEGAGEAFYMCDPIRDDTDKVIDFRLLDCNLSIRHRSTCRPYSICIVLRLTAATLKVTSGCHPKVVIGLSGYIVRSLQQKAAWRLPYAISPVAKRSSGCYRMSRIKTI
jgi:hypothetical protein